MDRIFPPSKVSPRQIQQKIAKARNYSEEFDQAGKMEKRQIIWTVTDWRLYTQAAVYIPTAALLSSISVFLPTIIMGTLIFLSQTFC